MDTSKTPTSTESPVSASTHLELGRRGEEFAAAYLQQAGFRIVAANFAIPVGRNRVGAVVNVEIDLVAYEAETLCFIEVKSRRSDWFAPPQVNVDRRKQRQIARAARAYRRMFGLVRAPYRFDVITAVFPTAGTSARGPEIQLLRNYWQQKPAR
jgi:putative endonuclease